MEETAPFFVGQKATLRRTVSAPDVEDFARVTGDTNPVHLDEAYAATTRFHHRIAHGMLAASYISALLGTEFPGPGTIYISQSLTFLRPVYLGDTLEVSAVVSKFRAEKSILTLETAVKNQNGDLVVSGEAVCLVADVVRSKAQSGAAAG
jgi:acyl dehydratase